MPIYNKEKYLNRSIGSIINQKLKNIEIIAVNDCSTDNTLKTLKKLSKKDSRIKITNNDRNLGLLYSRAMGILNSSGEYIMDLDPDDKFEGNSNLENLYNMAIQNNFDLIIFLIKRLSSDKKENRKAEIENKLQLQNEDYRITNKLIKREIFLKAYNNFSNEIYKFKWNYHEDNIWNILVRNFTKKKGILKKYIYIYKRNNESLNMKKGNIMDIKNRIYRLKKFFNIYLNDRHRFKLEYYFKSLIKLCNSTIFKDIENKKEIINISFKFKNIYNNDTKFSEIFNNILSKISDNKIIIFFDSKNITLNKILMVKSFVKKFKQKIKKNKKIVTININTNLKNDIIFNYIYNNDIIIGLDNIIFNKNFEMIIKKYGKNQYFILSIKKIYKFIRNYKIN